MIYKKADFRLYYKTGKKARNIYKAIVLFPRFLYWSFCLGQKRLIKELKTLQQKYNNSDCTHIGIALKAFDNTYREIYNKEYFKEYVDLEFEGHTFMASKNYHELLTLSYGDYMSLPKEEERVGHHNYIYFKKP